MIGRSGERGSGISVLPARHDDDDDDDFSFRFLSGKFSTIFNFIRFKKMIKILFSYFD